MVSHKNGLPVSAAPTTTVYILPVRTVAPHGVTGPELNRLSGAIRFMELHCQPSRGLTLWVVHIHKGTPRSAISNIQKRITWLQGGRAPTT